MPRYKCIGCGQVHDDNDYSASDGDILLEPECKPECNKGGLWLSAMGRIVLDDHNCETFCKPYDKKLLTKEELSKGIKLKDFQCKLLDAVGGISE